MVNQAILDFFFVKISLDIYHKYVLSKNLSKVSRNIQQNKAFGDFTVVCFVNFTTKMLQQ